MKVQNYSNVTNANLKQITGNIGLTMLKFLRNLSPVRRKSSNFICYSAFLFGFFIEITVCDTEFETNPKICFY